MYEVKMYRKVAPVSAGNYRLPLHLLEGMTIESESSEELAAECMKFSLDSNDSVDKLDQALYFMIVEKADGSPVAYGTPRKKKIDWTGTTFLT